MHSHCAPVTALCIVQSKWQGWHECTDCTFTKLTVLLETLKYPLRSWVLGDLTIRCLLNHDILIATVTASLSEDQSPRLFVSKADCFLLPGWIDLSQLLLDPCHGADKKIHTSGWDNHLSADTTSIHTTQLPGEGRKRKGKKNYWHWHLTRCFFQLAP